MPKAKTKTDPSNGDKNLGGRPCKYKTGAEFSAAVDEFIAYSTANNIRPTDYQITEYLKISPDTLERYSRKDTRDKRDIESIQGEDSIDNGYAAAIKKLAMYRQDWYLSHAEANPKLTAIDIFALKQPCNGGWADKQQADNGGSMSIDIKLSGASGEAFEDQAKADK